MGISYLNVVTYDTKEECNGSSIPVRGIDDIGRTYYVSLEEPAMNGIGPFWEVLLDDSERPALALLCLIWSTEPTKTLEEVLDNFVQVGENTFRTYTLVASKATSTAVADNEEAHLRLWIEMSFGKHVVIDEVSHV